MDRKSQIKFGETIGIIFVVYLVLVFGVMWYSSENESDLQEMKADNSQQQALEKYYYIIYSDLLKTSQRGFEKNYFDLVSMEALADYSKSKEGKDYLRGRLGEGLITLKLYNGSDVYSTTPGEIDKEFVLYNHSPEFREQSQLVRREVFTSLIPVQDDKKEGKIQLGVLRVEVPYYR